jgi:hypothetical protein
MFKRCTFWLYYMLVCGVVIGAGITVLLSSSAQPAPAHNDVVMEVLDPSLEVFAPMWQKEIGRRFPNAVGVLCHGVEFVNGQWIVSAKAYGRDLTAQDIVRFEQAHYPGRTIVLLCCNPGHLKLGIPGVYHADDSVWCVPDRSLTPEMFREANQKLAQCTPRCPCAHRASATTRPTAELDSDDVIAQPSRWETDPGVAGNIYEFIED